jgi:hypothetical protein
MKTLFIRAQTGSLPLTVYMSAGWVYNDNVDLYNCFLISITNAIDFYIVYIGKFVS